MGYVIHCVTGGSGSQGRSRCSILLLDEFERGVCVALVGDVATDWVSSFLWNSLVSVSIACIWSSSN